MKTINARTSFGRRFFSSLAIPVIATIAVSPGAVYADEEKAPAWVASPSPSFLETSPKPGDEEWPGPTGRGPASERGRGPAQNAARSHPPIRRVRIAPPPAPEFRTEYFWQPKGGHVSAQIAETQSSASYDLKTLGGITAGSVTQRSAVADVDFRYGFSDQFAFGIQWSPLGQTVSDTSSTNNPSVTRRSSGSGDFSFGLLNTTDGDGFKLHFGLNGRVPVTGAKSSAPSSFAPATTATADGNLSGGGISVEPFAGLSMKFSDFHHVGGKLGYRYFGQRTFDAQDGTTTTSAGGNAFELAGFYEFHAERFYVSPILTAVLNDSSVDTNSGRNSTNDQYTLTTIETDGGWLITPAFLFSAKLAYQLRQETKVGSYKLGYGAPVYGLTTRYEF